MKNIVIIGSNSVISRKFIKENKGKNKIIEISRKGAPGKMRTEHICFDMSIRHIDKMLVELSERIVKVGKKECETIILLMAWSGTLRTSSLERECEMHYSNNINIVDNTILLAKLISASKIVFLSSAGGVYNNKKAIKKTETTGVGPETPYGMQKLETEKRLFTLNEMTNIKILNLRLTCAYGYDEKVPDQGVLNKWMHEAMKGNIISVYNSLETSLNYISHEQISEVLEISVMSEIAGTYNIGSCSTTRLAEILECVKMLIPGIKIKQMGSEIRYLDIDTSKFEHATGRRFESLIIEDSTRMYREMKRTMGC